MSMSPIDRERYVQLYDALGDIVDALNDIVATNSGIGPKLVSALQQGRLVLERQADTRHAIARRVERRD